MKRGLAVVLITVLAATIALAQTEGATGGESATITLAESALYTVGNMGATQLYYTYLLLGMIGDSFSKGVYDQKTALSLAEEVSNLTTLSQKSLGRLSGDAQLSSDDRELVSNMNAAFATLLGQASGLSDFVNGKDDGTKFQTYRQSAWDQISKIIGIEGVKPSP
jgi:hypothetical protein